MPPQPFFPEPFTLYLRGDPGDASPSIQLCARYPSRMYWDALRFSLGQSEQLLLEVAQHNTEVESLNKFQRCLPHLIVSGAGFSWGDFGHQWSSQSDV